MRDSRIDAPRAPRVASTITMPLASGARLGPYEVIAPIGAGGMGEVYRARDTRLNRTVALKILPPELITTPDVRSRFEQEARAASALNHPNIVTIYDVGDSEFGAYIAMELVDGKTLRQVLADGPLPTRKLLQAAGQIGDGLAKAHGAGIVHRDLKPENVMITRDGLVKILDFGLAKLAETSVGSRKTLDETTLARTAPGLLLGTVGYMSPEQASGQTADYRADQFSFGAILYEMTTGKRAFQRGTPVETLSAIIRQEPEPLAVAMPRTPPPLRWIIDRCLAKAPDDRYASTRDLARELQSLLEHLPELEISTSAIGAMPATPVFGRRRRLIAAGVLVAGGALLAAALLLGRATPATRPVFRQLTFRHGNISGARFAADGQTVVYAATWVGEPAGLYVIRPENPESGTLNVAGAGIFSISSSGEAAVALGCRLNWGECIGTLARVPLTGGTPREIMEDVHGADWAPDGRTLATVQFSKGVYRLQYPSGKTVYESPGWITSPRVSPDGNLVAFLDHPILGDIGGSVCVVGQSGEKRTLSSGWKALQGLAWSADGTEIWLTGSRVSKGGSLELHAVTLRGRERVVFSAPGTLKLYDVSRNGRNVLLVRGTSRGGILSLSPGMPKERDLSWFDYSTVADLSSDGKMLLFYEWGEGVGGTYTVHLRRTDGSGAVRLGEGRPLALSPDGRWAAAVQQTTPPRLALLPTGAGEAKILPRGTVVEYLDWAAWAPNGRRIFFAGQESGNRRYTYIQDIEGGDPRPVTPEGIVGALLSPDGRSIAAVDRYGEYYICGLEGEECLPIEGYVDGDVLLQWNSDGRALFVRGGGSLELRIFKLDLVTGRRERWKELLPPDTAALTDIGSNPGQVRVTPDGHAYAYTYWTFVGELYLAQGLK